MTADSRNGAKTTAAPWEWRGNQLYAPAERSTLLRDVTFWNCDPGDKGLIAAAPELLAALKDLTEWASEARSAPLAQARAAIAKAEGCA